MDAAAYVKAPSPQYDVPKNLGKVRYAPGVMTINFDFSIPNSSVRGESIDVKFTSKHKVNKVARKMMSETKFLNIPPYAKKKFQETIFEALSKLIAKMVEKMKAVDDVIKPQLRELLEDLDNASTTGVVNGPDSDIDIETVNDDRKSEYRKIEIEFRAKLLALIDLTLQQAFRAGVKKFANKNGKVGNLDNISFAEKVGNITLIVAIIIVTIFTTVATGGIAAGVAGVVGVAFLALFGLDGLKKTQETLSMLWNRNKKSVDAFQEEIGTALTSLDNALNLLSAIENHGKLIDSEVAKLKERLKKSEAKLASSAPGAKTEKAQKAVEKLAAQVKQLESLKVAGEVRTYVTQIERMTSALEQHKKLVAEDHGVFGRVLGVVFNGFALVGRVADLKAA